MNWSWFVRDGLEAGDVEVLIKADGGAELCASRMANLRWFNQVFEVPAEPLRVEGLYLSRLAVETKTGR